MRTSNLEAILFIFTSKNSSGEDLSCFAPASADDEAAKGDASRYLSSGSANCSTLSDIACMTAFLSNADSVMFRLFLMAFSSNVLAHLSKVFLVLSKERRTCTIAASTPNETIVINRSSESPGKILVTDSTSKVSIKDIAAKAIIAAITTVVLVSAERRSLADKRVYIVLMLGR